MAIKIICGSTIEYTKGDTFELAVTSDAALDEGSKLQLVIAKDETSNPVVDNTYTMDSDGSFFMRFTEDNIASLDIMPYLYKITLISLAGKVITQLSGDFIVKWGV